MGFWSPSAFSRCSTRCRSRHCVYQCCFQHWLARNSIQPSVNTEDQPMNCCAYAFWTAVTLLALICVCPAQVTTGLHSTAAPNGAAQYTTNYGSFNIQTNFGCNNITEVTAEPYHEHWNEQIPKYSELQKLQPLQIQSSVATVHSNEVLVLCLWRCYVRLAGRR